MTQLEMAQAALASAREEPKPSIARAEDLLSGTDDNGVAAIAHFAIGMAHRTLANGAESTSHLERASQLAEDGSVLLGQVLRSLAFNYAQAGNHQLADATIANSIEMLSGQESDLSRLQAAFMLLMRGEHRTALPVLTAAVDGFTDSADDEYLELTLFNRALVHMEFGDYDASIEDLRKAYDIGVGLQHDVAASEAALHLSQVLGWRDDIPGAMEWHARSVELRERAGAPSPLADTEHAFVLIQARLLREAEQALRSALPRLVAAGGNHAIAVAGRLLLADVLTQRGDHPGALAQLETAAEESPIDSRWRFDIASAFNRIRAAAGERSADLLGSMLETAADMEANGERHSAAVETCRALDQAVAIRDEGAMTALDRAVHRAAVTGPLWLQIQAWTSLGNLRIARGNRPGTAAAVRAGLRRLDEYRSGIGATDLRVYATEMGSRLAEIGITLAVRSGSPSRVFEIAERIGDTAPTNARSTPEIEAALARLRRAAASVRTAANGEVATARQRLSAAEREVNALTHQATSRAVERNRTSIDEVQPQLGGRTLVRYVVFGASIGAVVITDDGARLVESGPLEAITGPIDHLRFAAERIARPSTSAASRAAAIASVDEIAAVLNRNLIAPLGLTTDRLVVVPSGPLHGIPWALVTGAHVETAPTASAWLSATRRPHRDGPSVVVQGPDLAHAREETTRVAGAAQSAITNTVGDTIDRLATASKAHFACHARPRVDNPMFSSLVLDDGEITLHDVERLSRVPTTVVLASCAGGGNVLASGDEVVSIAGSFLAMGSRTVLAPLFTVSDGATAHVMARVQELADNGTDPARALLEIGNEEEPTIAFTALSFNCFGTI